MSLAYLSPGFPDSRKRRMENLKTLCLAIGASVIAIAALIAAIVQSGKAASNVPGGISLWLSALATTFKLTNAGIASQSVASQVRRLLGNGSGVRYSVLRKLKNHESSLRNSLYMTILAKQAYFALLTLSLVMLAAYGPVLQLSMITTAGLSSQTIQSSLPIMCYNNFFAHGNTVRTGGGRDELLSTTMLDILGGARPALPALGANGSAKFDVEGLGWQGKCQQSSVINLNADPQSVYWVAAIPDWPTSLNFTRSFYVEPLAAIGSVYELVGSGAEVAVVRHLAYFRAKRLLQDTSGDDINNFVEAGTCSFTLKATRFTLQDGSVIDRQPGNLDLGPFLHDYSESPYSGIQPTLRDAVPGLLLVDVETDAHSNMNAAASINLQGVFGHEWTDSTNAVLQRLSQIAESLELRGLTQAAAGTAGDQNCPVRIGPLQLNDVIIQNKIRWSTALAAVAIALLSVVICTSLSWITRAASLSAPIEVLPMAIDGVEENALKLLRHLMESEDADECDPILHTVHGSETSSLGRSLGLGHVPQFDDKHHARGTEL